MLSSEECFCCASGSSRNCLESTQKKYSTLKKNCGLLYPIWRVTDKLTHAINCCGPSSSSSPFPQGGKRSGYSNHLVLFLVPPFEHNHSPPSGECVQCLCTYITTYTGRPGIMACQTIISTVPFNCSIWLI